MNFFVSFVALNRFPAQVLRPLCIKEKEFDEPERVENDGNRHPLFPNSKADV